MNTAVHIIIVTHDSKQEIQQCLDHLSRQSHEVSSIVIVDSGSANTEYLDTLSSRWPLHIFKQPNIGFSQANNLGFNTIENGKNSHIIFLNPDTFLNCNFIKDYLSIADEHSFTAITGKLLSYDLQHNRPTGRIDSTGIYRAWYGRWYDQGQGQIDNGQYDKASEPLALCGALICCRYNDLLSLGGSVFDTDFFLYKEDIELGLRLRKKGWKLLFHPELIAYHCRGWQEDRKKIAYELKKTAAKNEIILYRKHPSLYMVWALFKYFAVVCFKL